jgi:hypothetical protein
VTRSSAHTIWVVALLAALTVPESLTLPYAAVKTKGTTGLAQPQDPGDGGAADDAVRRLLLAGPSPPRDIFQIRQRLEAHGGRLKAHIVVNGGHENPARTPADREKFMVFETYANATPDRLVEEDELFFGFFVGAANNILAVLPGFVELIAWDRTKQVYNFWELLGDKWHYRGDSNDVLTNVERINVASPNPSFNIVRKSPTDGQPVLRCSGCHTLGGPIMKELEPPHNDWWTTARKLDLGPFSLQPGNEAANPAHVAARAFDETKEATDAANLNAQVKKGIDRLLAARGTRADGGTNLRLQLRSLFTTMEFNLVSDRIPFKERTARNEAIEIPTDFFVDARLTKDRQPVSVNGARYKEALAKVGSRFAPKEKPGLVETFNAFLVPARSHIDNRWIATLIQRGMLDDELVADVLAVDFTTPVFSLERKGLVRHVPAQAKDARDLRDQLVTALKTAPSTDRAAAKLLANLTESGSTAASHRQAVDAYLAACRKAASSLDAVVGWLRVAAQRRVEIVHSETASNEPNVITEPGFRVIFSEYTLASQPKPGALRLDPVSCLPK